MASKTPDPQRRARYKKGIRAERWAQAKLRLNAFSILTQRYKTPRGEVDIIARRGKMLVFTEVKARLTAQAGIEAVSAHQQTRIVQAAHAFIAHYPEYAHHTMRFDVIASSHAPIGSPRLFI
jgi:putative endonuclease